MFRRLLSSLSGQKKSQPRRPARPRNRVQLGLEALETRIAPVLDPIGGAGNVITDRSLAAVVKIGGAPETVGTGILIRNDWVLTAAHVALSPGGWAPGTMPISIGGDLYHDRLVGGIFIHWGYSHPRSIPGDDHPEFQYDFALIHLDRPVPNVGPMPIYGDLADGNHHYVPELPAGTRGIIAGYGQTGDGTNGATPGTSGQLHAGVVTVGKTYYGRYLFQFESGTAAAAPGDSGGPFIIGTPTTDRNGNPAGYRYYVAGINVAGSDYGGTGNRYGGFTQSIISNVIRPWIYATIEGAGGDGLRPLNRYVIAPDGSFQEDGGLDITAPVINSRNLQFVANTGTGAPADFSSITVTDDYDVRPTMTFTRADTGAILTNGSVLPVGQTRIDVTATDAAGNRATASFVAQVASFDVALTQFGMISNGRVFPGWEVLLSGTYESHSSVPVIAAIEYFLSRDSVWDKADIRLGNSDSLFDGPYLPGQPVTRESEIRIPSDTSPGNYFLVARAHGAGVNARDLADDVKPEDNERAIPLTVEEFQVARIYTVPANTRFEVPAEQGVRNWLFGNQGPAFYDDPQVYLDSNREPSHGQVYVNKDGSFIYVPDAGFLGTDTFRCALLPGNFGPGFHGIAIDVTVNVVAMKVNSNVVVSTPRLVSASRPATFIATVGKVGVHWANPTGLVTFLVDGVQKSQVSLSSGQATFTTTLAAGKHTITASYAGDANFNASTGALDVTAAATKAESSVALTASQSPALAGQPLTLTATVSPGSAGGTPSGVVTFFVNGAQQGQVTLANGRADFTTTLAAGSYAVTASYAGDANFNASTSPELSQSVNQPQFRDPLANVRQQYGFQFGGSWYLNYYGRSEKWLLDRNNAWYFLTPDGALRKWNGRDFAGSLVVITLATAIYVDPTQLFPPVVKLSAEELRQQYGFQFGGNWYLNYYGQQEKWLLDRNNAWYLLTPDGKIRKWNGKDFTGSTVIATAVAGAYADPTQMFAAVPKFTADELRYRYGFRFGGSWYLNYYGRQEKWLLDRNNIWHLLTPDGTLRQWNGKDFAGSAVIATVGAAVYLDPTQLF